MPSWKTHREVSELYGIGKEVCKDVSRIIDFGYPLNDEDIKIKHLEYLSDSGNEIREIIKNLVRSHDDRREIPRFFIKAQITYDKFGEEGLKEFFLHHALDCLNWYTTPRTWFGEQISVKPSDLTRWQQREISIKVIYDNLYKWRDYKLRLSLSESPELCMVLYHILTPDVFAIKEDNSAGIMMQYEFNDRVRWLVDDVKTFIQSNWSRILEIIEENEILEKAD
ncbi:hypothetical protein AFULGI_00016940 [Archaeoglobus fulgidus DSM 8774]|uniref:Uncharacterized protein n=1 Tax=Archaeoglobus fulgidus DSM 8774 TaxID=1344584 RepID=A0A075WLM6_ARCFL|nr:hypothetical protein [Archaeoglobus fulgidus]AIG98453.1 hypothetical protein AFULGI_00016940 [Archaeoglobus fulgidus DSM 8774]